MAEKAYFKRIRFLSASIRHRKITNIILSALLIRKFTIFETRVPANVLNR